MPTNIHRRPSARQIHPMGLRGCLEAIRAPTMGKARKDTKLNISPTVPTVTQGVGDFADRMSTSSIAVAKNIARERPASDQASQETARGLILSSSSPLLRPFHHYSTLQD